MSSHQLILTALLLAPVVGLTHHSFAEFDQNIVEEYQGQIVDVFWRNPHVRLSIRSEDASGQAVIWRMEAQDVNTLRRIGVTPDIFQEGQRVRFAGWPSVQQDAHMALTHLFLIDSNTEVVMRRATAPRWTERAIGGGDITSDPRLAATGTADGIFRVWSFLAQRTPEFSADPPLTAAARAAFEAFDPVRDDPVLNCAQPGMPEAITFIGPHPIEFVDRDDEIRLRIESDDVTRVIHMGEDPRPDEQPPSPLGFSVGRWEDEDTLVVTTTGVSWPWTKVQGLVAVPQSPESVFTERFTMSEAQSQLTLSLSISDPQTFTRSVSAEEYTVWRWLPGAAIEPYDCTL